ncbi:hypothetical protein ACIQRJ_07570 [Streptomyces niveus]|uniref:hypothetical protein n=1 Tax=Streptomyces TaxID=1883 RepID=UPI001072F340|nr:hypothetical protein [Streptomyces sp. 4R-3d]TFI20874.1 hypothetical protein E4P36_34815 [Streptomyces sp. 4R-3d]
MSGRLSRLREDLQQRRHHRAFRIAPLPSDEPSREELARLLASVAASTTDPGVEQQAPVESPLEEKALADAATNLWRAQRRLTRQGEEASTRSRQTGRYLRSCREALDEAGLLVQEHEGDAFHAGRSLEALAFEDDPSLEADTVRETIRPTIYLHGRRIQMGQVIVGCPPKAPELSEPPELPGSPEPEDAVPAPAPALTKAPAPAPVSEAPSSSDHERTDHA